MNSKNEEIIPPIDYAKSISKERLVYTKRGWFNIDEILFNFSIPLWFFVLSISSISLFSNGEYLPSLFFLILFTWIIVSYIFKNKLIKVKGKSLSKNKEDVINTLLFFYDDLTFDENDANIFRHIKLKPPHMPGRVITVLFDNDIIYFHKITLGRGNAMTLWTAPIDYIKTQTIADHFEDLQNNSI